MSSCATAHGGLDLRELAAGGFHCCFLLRVIQLKYRRTFLDMPAVIERDLGYTRTVL